MSGEEMKDLYDYLHGVQEDSANIEHDEAARSAMKKRKVSEKGGIGGGVEAAGVSGAASSSSGLHTKQVRSQISLELPTKDRNQLLLSPNVDFSFASKLYEQAHLKQHGALEAGSLDSASTSTSKKKKDYRSPIIIVPSVSSALISLFNAKQVGFESNKISPVCVCVCVSKKKHAPSFAHSLRHTRQRCYSCHMCAIIFPSFILPLSYSFWVIQSSWKVQRFQPLAL
jgi:hypothetical protein